MERHAMVGAKRKSEFPKPKPKVGRIAAETQLLAHLSEAMKLISEGELKTRDGIMEAIEAVLCFLLDRGVSSQQILPFGLLRDELDDVFQGNRSPILQPGIDTWEDTAKRYSGPAKRPTKVFAAACSEALYKMGRSRAEADQLVSSRMAKWPAFDRCDNTPRTIKSWRDKFGKDDAFQILVSQFMHDIEGQRHLDQVLMTGPPHVRGFQKRAGDLINV